MDTIFSRYRNLTILAAVLFAQVLILAFQVKRQTDSGPVSLARSWVIAVISPLEKAVVHSGRSVSNGWQNYVWLRGLHSENDELRAENERLRLEQIRLIQDAAQARRLQALFGFKEQVISQTVAAQVIGTSGTESSRIVYIDKDANDGIKTDMPVITSEGVVGKILKTFKGSSQVLLITDQSSGVGAILEKSRLQGILKGSAAGETAMHYVMSDEKVEPGERVLTSGGDGVFPKGLPIGTVTQSALGADMFLNIRVKPAAPIARLEEVLVITKVELRAPTPEEAASTGPRRAADILAERLPTIKVAPPDETAKSKEPPTMAETIRQQKLAQQQQNKPANKTTGEPPTAAQFMSRQPKPTASGATTGSATTARPAAPPPTSGAAANSTPAPKKPASTTTTTGTQTEPKQPAANKPVAKPKPAQTTPPTPTSQPPSTPPGVTL